MHKALEAAGKFFGKKMVAKEKIKVKGPDKKSTPKVKSGK